MHFHADDCPPEVLEAFLESVVAFESARRSSLFERLSREACLTPAPDSISDPELPAKILEIAQALARQGFYLERTDHLSDRELYVKLWNDVLHEEYEDAGPGGRWHLDMLGSETDEDILDHLRYYADQESREMWREEFPDFELPPRLELPYDRDRFLPQAR